MFNRTSSLATEGHRVGYPGWRPLWVDGYLSSSSDHVWTTETSR